MKRLKAFLEKINPGKSIVSGICVMIALGLMCSFAMPFLGVLCILTAVIYTCVICIYTYRERKKSEELTGPLKEGVTMDFLIKNIHAVLLVDHRNNVIWCNGTCARIFGAIRGKSLGEICDDFTPEAIELIRSADKTVEIKVGTQSYEASGVVSNTYKKDCCIITLVSLEKAEALRHGMLMARSSVALISIDNFSEATRSVGDTQKREAQNAIGAALDEWSRGLDAVLKEYERNHFLLILEEEKLLVAIGNKFNILDTIKEIEIEGVNIPFTASIGVSRIDGTLSDKLDTAKSALELALSRGGDQAVVTTAQGSEFFGAKLLGGQRHSRVRTRNFALQLVEKIKKSGNVIIMGHRFADHDSIGSCFGIAKLCTWLGKKAHVIINIHDSNCKPIFSQMRGNEDYTELLTDAVSAQDFVRSDTLVIVCDVNNIRQFEAPDVFKAASDYVIIDHHRKTESIPGDTDNTYIEPSSSSASELVAEILEFSLEKGTLTPFESNLMYAGILLDTKHFTKNTGATTFAAAQYLRSEGCNPTEAQSLFRTELSDFVKEASFESDVEVIDGIAFAKSRSEKTDNNDRIAMAKAADKLLGVARIRAAFAMCVIDGAVCISGRSDGTFNVQVILEKLGGGGHYDAAAAQIKGKSLEEVETELRRLCANASGD